MARLARRDEAAVKITALHVEGFVDKYLLENYDKPAPTPPFHRLMWEDCCSDEQFVAEAAPRDHAKSTAITEGYSLAALLWRNRDFCLIVSNTLPQSIEFLRDIKTELSDNESLRRDFRIKDFLIDREDDVIVRCTDGHQFRIMCKGAEQSMRGTKWAKRKPNLIVCDDLEEDEQVMSEPRRKKFRRWFLRTLLSAGSRDCLFRVVGTILHHDSMLNNLLKETDDPKRKAEDAVWKSRRFRAHRGYNDFRDILWPEKFTEKDLRKIKQRFINQMDPDGYSSEYLNNPIADGSGYFREEDFRDSPDVAKKFYKNMNHYASWDLAVSEKTSANRTACHVAAVDQNKDFHIRHRFADRIDSKKIVDKIFQVQWDFNCVFHIIEEGVLDKAIMPFVHDYMRTHPNEFVVFETYKRQEDKTVLARPFQALMRSGRVYWDSMTEWYQEVKEIFLHFPKGTEDDDIDAAAGFGQKLEMIQEGRTEDEADEDDYFERYGQHQTASNNGANRTTGY